LVTKKQRWNSKQICLIIEAISSSSLLCHCHLLSDLSLSGLHFLCIIEMMWNLEFKGKPIRNPKL
jgi:hypothetical protein